MKMPSKKIWGLLLLVLGLGVLFLIFTDQVAFLNHGSPLKKTGGDERFRYYEGEVEVSGEYVDYRDSVLFQGDQLCFNVDEATSHLIPREKGDDRYTWFCFSNKEEAVALLNVDESAFNKKDVCALRGTATIVVSNYVVDRGESEVWDTAKLERVQSKTTPETGSCADYE